MERGIPVYHFITTNQEELERNYYGDANDGTKKMEIQWIEKRICNIQACIIDPPNW